MMPVTLAIIFWIAEKIKIKFIQKQKKFYHDYYSRDDQFQQNRSQ